LEQHSQVAVHGATGSTAIAATGSAGASKAAAAAADAPNARLATARSTTRRDTTGTSSSAGDLASATHEDSVDVDHATGQEFKRT
jgi:hypothetical protein